MFLCPSCCLFRCLPLSQFMFPLPPMCVMVSGDRSVIVKSVPVCYDVLSVWVLCGCHCVCCLQQLSMCVLPSRLVCCQQRLSSCVLSVKMVNHVSKGLWLSRYMTCVEYVMSTKISNNVKSKLCCIVLALCCAVLRVVCCARTWVEAVLANVGNVCYGSVWW